MSKTRQRGFPDGNVVVRTFPVTFLHDVTQSRNEQAWHTLIYALKGNLEVRTGSMRQFVPADRAVWIPLGTECSMVMRAPISMRSLFFAPAVLRRKPSLKTVLVSPLLRELILEVTKLGALDRSRAKQARLLGVLLDELDVAKESTLAIPSPRDPRARRFADAIRREPGDDRSVGQIAESVGASLRTIERCFRVETGLTAGEWRRRVRLFHALQLLESGATSTTAAIECGYQSLSAFTQAFRKQFGRTPKAGRSETGAPVGRW